MGTVPAMQEITVNVTFRPSRTSGGKNEEENLVMKITDGTDRKLKYLLVFSIIKIKCIVF